MKILVGLFFFCSFHTLCQLKVDFSTTSQHERFLFSNVAGDGAYLVEETYKNTEMLKEHYFYHEDKDENAKQLYNVDSVKRYYENGDLAFSGIVLDQKYFNLGDFDKKGFFTISSVVCFYKDGSKRAIKYEDEINENLNYFFCYFDKETNKVIYRKEVFNGERISGTFFLQVDGNWVVSFYEDGEVKEKWTISSDIFTPVDAFVLKKVELSDSTVISSPKKLKEHINGRSVFLWEADLIVY